MARYQYAGPGPLEVQDLAGKPVDLIRPGDVREFADYPSFGPWEPLDEPEATPGAGQQSGAGPAPAQAAADGGQPIVTPPALTAPKGM